MMRIYKIENSQGIQTPDGIVYELGKSVCSRPFTVSSGGTVEIEDPWGDED